LALVFALLRFFFLLLDDVDAPAVVGDDASSLLTVGTIPEIVVEGRGANE
jgi:hypothetical protein